MSLSDPVLTGPGGGRTVTYGHGSSGELKLVGEQSGGDWAVVEWRVRAGDEPPIHTHTREDETVYVLDGAITAFVADQRIDVDAGSYAALPKDVPHGLSVRGNEARLLITLEPWPEVTVRPPSFRRCRWSGLWLTEHTASIVTTDRSSTERACGVRKSGQSRRPAVLVDHPPSRSRRWTRPRSAACTRRGVGRSAFGGLRSSARCGRCVL